MVCGSVDSHLLLPPCPCFTAHALLVWALGWWMPLLISYVLPQCVCVWCGVWYVCGWTPPECAVAAQRPRVRAPSAVLQRLPVQDPRSLFEGADCRFVYSLVADTAHCMLSPPSPTPLASPLAPPWWVCVWSRV